jgi:hypothetical protein
MCQQPTQKTHVPMSPSARGFNRSLFLRRRSPMKRPVIATNDIELNLHNAVRYVSVWRR